MKKILSLMSVLMAAAGLLAATPTVTKVTAQQRYPWNGKVDIVVTMNGLWDDVARATCAFTATNSATQAALAMIFVTEVGRDPVPTGVESWTRHYVWDATADLGEAQIADVAINVAAVSHGSVQLWANGPYWAECNVGASEPEESGYYFWWGDTVGYKRNASDNGWVSVKDDTSFTFDDSNCPTFGKDNSTLQSLGYIDSTGNLVAAHDAATVHFGAPWRMPTSDEIDALVSNCTTTWTTRNGVYGYLVTGKGEYATKSIFLPAAGGSEGSLLFDTGSCGYYWSSTPNSDDSNLAWDFYFEWGDLNRYYTGRLCGQPVRPLRDSNKSTITSSTVTAHVALDTRTVARANAGTMEQIRFSPAWETAVNEAVATVYLNGVAVMNAKEAGIFEWMPTQSGTNTFTHVVSCEGVQIGEALSATFVVEGPDPTVTAVTAQPRYPWNGKVDLVVTINGMSNDVAQTTCVFTATNSATQAALAITSVTEVGTGPVAAGAGAWTRHYVWDVAADVGETQIANVAINVGVALPLGGVQLWKNGPCWTECNVGASNPEEYGYYFWWGDTVGYKRNASNNGWVSVKNGASFTFDDSNCPTFGKGISTLQSLGYIDSTGNLVAAHDAATAHFGAPWRMPTLAEIEGLVSNCTTTWTTRNGVYGCLVTGKGEYASKSIFLPAAGGGGEGSHLSNVGSCGYYWSSTPYSGDSDIGDSDIAWSFYFDWGYFNLDYNGRICGQPVRPLRDANKSTITKSTVTAHVALDTRMRTRTNAGTTEQIRFSPAWETAADGAVATVCLNGVAVTNATEAGAFAWTPVQEGTYTFTHAVSVNGVQTGETLSATFNVLFATQTTDVPVPFDWLKRYYPSVSDYESKAKETAANGHNTVEEAYVAGLDPTSSTSELEATVACSNGVVYVGWTPNLNTNSVARIYTLYGRTDLTTGEWETPIQPWHRFFKVAVAMPTGAAGEETSVAGEGFVPQDDPAALGGVQLWKDGPYWAECNVGASKPEEYGYYFWWGDTVGYKRVGSSWNAVDGSKTGFIFESENCPTYGKSNSSLQSLGYIDSTGNLVAAHDAATAHLGAPWRMPTDAEMSALISNCTTAWITTNGIYGRLVIGKGDYASKSIFLPAAGYGYGSGLYDTGSYGDYWSSAPDSDDSDSAWYLDFGSGYFGRYIYYRFYGQSVRPLREFAQ